MREQPAAESDQRLAEAAIAIIHAPVLNKGGRGVRGPADLV